MRKKIAVGSLGLDLCTSGIGMDEIFLQTFKSLCTLVIGKPILHYNDFKNIPIA